jgi:phosphate transport system substrate-binding protein
MPNRQQIRFSLASAAFIAIIAVPVFSQAPPPAAPAAAQPAPKPAVPKARILFRLHGSKTIGVQLGPALAKAFLQQQGATGVSYVPGSAPSTGLEIGKMSGESVPVAIEIRANGSAGGISDLANGTADVAMLTRKIKPEEKTQVSRFGDLEAYGAENILGLEDVVIIVHTSNPVTRLTVEQVRKIFSGEIKNWKEVGGADIPVQVYSRPKAISGIYETFETLVLKPASLSAGAKLLDSNEKLSDAVAADPGAVGYTSLPYIRSAKAVAIATADTKPLLPNTFTIGREDYPLTRRLYLYLPPECKNVDARLFITFSLSPTGQTVVEKNGFVSQSVTVDQTHQQGGGSAMNLTFRFRPGTTQLDNKSLEDLNRLIEYLKTLPENPPILLIGHTDNTGNEEENVRLSKERANAVAEELRARGINIAGTGGQGSKNPIASNDTPEGRLLNRRVEIWTRM